MTIRLMVDSGAYGIWSLGATIGLQTYIDFCAAHPDTSYYIALDVIPGTKANPIPSKEAAEQACKEGWQNYEEMCRQLPRDKVIPVFHFPDDIKWLHKILDSGCEYVALGGISRASEESRLGFLRRAKPLLFDGAGTPKVRVHGLGMTSFALMKYWRWHSVDSTSWKQFASWGWIFVPQRTRGEWDFSKDPHVVGASPMSKASSRKQKHLFSMSPHVKALAMDYLESEGLTLGEWRIDQVSDDYSISRGSEEFWYDKRKRVLLRTIVKGVATSFEERCKLTWGFMRKAEKVLPVKHIYAAGAITPYVWETRMTNRLLSYFDLRKKVGHKHMQRHTDTMKARAK